MRLPQVGAILRSACPGCGNTLLDCSNMTAPNPTERTLKAPVLGAVVSPGGSGSGPPLCRSALIDFRCSSLVSSY